MTPRLRNLFILLCAIFIAWAVLSRIWVAEDAYITFRSVENLYAGHGLVFNPGVYSEASTHPLWTLLLIVIRGMGLPLHFGAILLGLGFSGAALVLMMKPRWSTDDAPTTAAGSDASQTLASPGAGAAVRAFPFAALALVSISGFRDFATAGMEYSLVFLLLTLLFRGFESYRLTERPFAFASLLALLYLCRPELGLMVAYYSVWILIEVFRPTDAGFAGRLLGFWRSWSTLGPLLQWAAGILLFAGSYHLFRGIYYHDIFPNTYYAKSGLSSYYLQGFRYFFNALWWGPGVVLIVAAVFGLPLLHRFRTLLRPRAYVSYLRELGVVALLSFYVLRVGGDFMAFRFLLPEIVMLALLADRFFRAAPDLPRRLLGRLIPDRFPDYVAHLALLAIFFACALRPIPLYQGSISDERQFFVRDISGGLPTLLTGQNHPWGQRGRTFRDFQSCLQLDDFWITNSQAQAGCLKGIGLGYFGVAAGPGVKILDEQALPNRDVAQLPVLVRWRPGHEHYLDLSNVLRRGAAFCSTGEPAYDRAMLTKIGIVIDLRPELLATLPNISARLQRLADLKAAGSPVVTRLETRYGTTIEELQTRSAQWEADPELRRRSECWNDHGAGPASFFY
ncbi:MAG: hypothetical protein NXI24_01820 [bacterium]|nr:hypothetical protein [bacterium]